MIRSKLKQRRPLAVRRHTARVTTRFAILLGGDLIALWLSEFVATALSNAGTVGHPTFSALMLQVHNLNSSPLYFAQAILWIHLTGSYSRHRSLHGRVRILTASALASALLVWPIVRAGDASFAVSVYLATAALTWGAVAAVRVFSEYFLSNVWPRSRGAASALIVGRTPSDLTPAEKAVVDTGGDYALGGYITPDRSIVPGANGVLADLPTLIEESSVEAVVLSAELPPDHLQWILQVSLAAGCQLLYPARAVNIPNVRPRLVWHRDQPFFELGAPVLKAQAVIAKRVVDVIVSLLALVILAPVFVIIAILIKLDSPGPVLFVQDRAGLGGQKFRLLKFRTMTDGADNAKLELSHLNQTGDARLFKIRNDPRVTRLGNALRRWSLDELPQFVNVLLGHMSLVGPRPFFESDFDFYEDHHFRRLDAKPGITGLWQVSGRSEVLDFEDVVYLDRQYIEQWSFWLDVSIMFRTLPAIVRRTGAY